MTLKTLFFLLVSNFGWAQIHQTTKVVVDAETQIPIEYVNVYNNSDNTISNSDGSFIFRSIENLINMSAVGYRPQSTTFDRINKSDTIFLESNSIELEELVITNTTSLLNEVYRNVSKNYPTSTYKEKFFLLCIVKKNDEVTRLQDVFGKIERNTLFRNENIKKTNYNAEF